MTLNLKHFDLKGVCMKWEFSKAVFFDMDGVLYDSMPNHEVTWTESFRSAGIDFPPMEAYRNEGRTGKETIQLAFRLILGREATDRECETIYAEKTRLMTLCAPASKLEGIAELIETLRAKQVYLGVVTGSKQPLLLDKLASDFGFRPQQIVSAKDVQRGKPHPEPYRLALLRSGCTPSECVVVENAPLGIRSAKAAGLLTVAVNTGLLPNEVLWQEQCDALFASTQALANHWHTILASPR